MINDYKKAFKLMTLSPKFKMQIILASIFFILGIVLDIASTGATVTGGVYIFIPAISMMELFYGANESGLIKSSPIKKKTLTYFPFLVTAPYSLIVYTLLAFYHAYLSRIDSPMSVVDEYAMQVKYIYALGLLVLLLLVYSAACYKGFVLSTIVFVIIVIPLIGCSQSQYLFLDFFGAQDINVAIGIGYLLVLLGLVLSMAITRLFYFRDIDRLSMRGIMKNA